MRSKPNCKIDYAAAETMYRATTEFCLEEDGTPSAAQILGAYLGWALDEIDRLMGRLE